MARRPKTNIEGRFLTCKSIVPNMTPGRWPANLCHDGSPEVLAGFPDTGPSSDAVRVNRAETQFGFGNGRPEGRLSTGHSDSGSAARFFYTSKADRRTQAFKNAFANGLRIAFWFVLAILIGFGLVWAYHMVAPPDWHFLPERQVDRLQYLLLGAITSNLFAGAMRRYLR